jgi:hypothetical protein
MRLPTEILGVARGSFVDTEPPTEMLGVAIVRPVDIERLPTITLGIATGWPVDTERKFPTETPVVV